MYGHVISSAKIKVDFMQQTTERNSVKSNIVGGRSEITWRYRLCDSPIPSQASLFSLSRSSSARKENKNRGIFLDPQAQGNVCRQATLRPFFFVIRHK